MVPFSQYSACFQLGVPPALILATSPIDTTSQLAGISRSDEIVLLFFGEEKLAIYEQARADANGFPVSKLLRQKRAPVRVFWAP